jgi:hypothetical protein
MGETEQITVAEASEGFGCTDDPGTEVDLPVVELLTGRGFVTGKSGSGKSNSASVIAEKLLDNGFGLLIVDIDGEYYGLKEEYEILHAGADEECDIQVTTDHAEKLASLALEQNVPIILDVSSYLDESEAEEMLTAVARSLFAKAKKQKQPFLLLVEEVHEFIPENGSVGECGRMLIKIGKRGRKHGLGICGISQRPADVKKDFITQCDWLLWHRLTWNNDTKVVRRILDGEYAQAVENLDDGEGFLMTDWSETVRRVQFYRKQTFDAGATPGLDDFERPDLKSVSDNLVSELEEISDQRQETENRIAELREELDKKNSRIAELETELQDARDLSRMAEQFVTAMVEAVSGPQPGRTERERMRDASVIQYHPEETVDPVRPEDGQVAADVEEISDGDDESGVSDQEMFEAFEAFGDEADTATKTNGEAESVKTNGEAESAKTNGEAESAKTNGEAVASTDGGATTEVPTENGQSAGATNTSGEHEGAGEFSADAIMDALNSVEERPVEEETTDNGLTPREEIERSMHKDAEFVDDPMENKEDPVEFDEPGPEGMTDSDNGPQEPVAVRELKADIAGFPTKTRKMLEFYREQGPGTPLNAHFAAGGDGDRTNAYAHNRRLRTRGLIEHVGRGKYEYCLKPLLRDELDGITDPEELDEYVAEVESATLGE